MHHHEIEVEALYPSSYRDLQTLLGHETYVPRMLGNRALTLGLLPGIFSNSLDWFCVGTRALWSLTIFFPISLLRGIFWALVSHLCWALISRFPGGALFAKGSLSTLGPQLWPLPNWLGGVCPFFLAGHKILRGANWGGAPLN